MTARALSAVAEHELEIAGDNGFCEAFHNQVLNLSEDQSSVVQGGLGEAQPDGLIENRSR